MIVGVGVDVVDVARFARALTRTPGLGRRLFTDAERTQARMESLAARFAAKEAVAKALGAPGGLRWRDAEVVPEASGRPTIVVHGGVAAEAALVEVGQFFGGRFEHFADGLLLIGGQLQIDARQVTHLTEQFLRGGNVGNQEIAIRGRVWCVARVANQRADLHGDRGAAATLESIRMTRQEAAAATCGDCARFADELRQQLQLRRRCAHPTVTEQIDAQDIQRPTPRVMSSFPM